MWAVLRMWRPWDRKHVPPDCTHRNPTPLPAEHLPPTSTGQSKFPGSSPPSLGQRGGPSSIRPGTGARRDSSSVEDLPVPQILEGVSAGQPGRPCRPPCTLEVCPALARSGGTSWERTRAS